MGPAAILFYFCFKSVVIFFPAHDNSKPEDRGLPNFGVTRELLKDHSVSVCIDILRKMSRQLNHNRNTTTRFSPESIATLDYSDRVPTQYSVLRCRKGEKPAKIFKVGTGIDIVGKTRVHYQVFFFFLRAEDKVTPDDIDPNWAGINPADTFSIG